MVVLERSRLAHQHPTRGRLVIPNVVESIPDAKLRRCYDCGHMKAALSWWCTNDGAVRMHGTAIPGRSGCPFWTPAKRRGAIARLLRATAGAIRSKPTVNLTSEQRAALEALRQHAYSLVPVGESKAVAALLAAFSEDR